MSDLAVRLSEIFHRPTRSRERVYPSRLPIGEPARLDRRDLDALVFAVCVAGAVAVLALANGVPALVGAVFFGVLAVCYAPGALGRASESAGKLVLDFRTATAPPRLAAEIAERRTDAASAARSAPTDAADAHHDAWVASLRRHLVAARIVGSYSYRVMTLDHEVEGEIVLRIETGHTWRKLSPVLVDNGILRHDGQNTVLAVESYGAAVRRVQHGALTLPDFAPPARVLLWDGRAGPRRA